MKKILRLTQIAKSDKDADCKVHRIDDDIRLTEQIQLCANPIRDSCRLE